MTLKELEQQIVSEAVKAFREKMNLPEMWLGDAPLVQSDRVESFLTEQLTQAMRKYGEASDKRAVSWTIDNHGMLNDTHGRDGDGETFFEYALRVYRSWLNHNSEEGEWKKGTLETLDLETLNKRLEKVEDWIEALKSLPPYHP